jgi:hypothetical protein
MIEMKRGEALAVRAGLLVGTLYILGFFIALKTMPPTGTSPTPGQIHMFAFLTLFPPAWFFLESCGLYGYGHGKNPDYIRGQELASKLWIACSVVAGLYWFHKL